MYLWEPLPEGLASAAFQKRALEEVGVVTLPGSAFGAGAEGFFRIALTVGTPRLVEAAERLGKGLAAGLGPGTAPAGRPRGGGPPGPAPPRGQPLREDPVA